MDISRNMLAVLLLLVIVVSGLGTMSMLGHDGHDMHAAGIEEPANGGEVALVVQQIPHGQGVVALDVIGAGGTTNG